MNDLSPLVPFAGGVALGVFRASVGTPLDAITTREVTKNVNTRTSIAQLRSERAFFTGFTPNAVKLGMKTPVQILTTGGASHLYTVFVPKDTRDKHPALRGTFIGITASVLETLFWANPLTSLRTKMMTEEKAAPNPMKVEKPLALPNLLSSFRPFKTNSSIPPNTEPRLSSQSLFPTLGKEHVRLLLKGVDAALLHRGASGIIFFTTYEKLKSLYPDNHFLVSTAAGVTQVAATSLSYNAMIHEQKSKAVTTNIFSTWAVIYKTQGLPGLFLRGLAPRLVHSIAVSHLVMRMLEAAGAINRN